MFLKEIVSIFFFGSGLFVASGFTLKVDKFENNHMVFDPKTNNWKVYIPLNNFKKMNLKTGENFNYLVNNETKMKKITQIEYHDNYIELTFNSSQNSGSEPRTEPIKYYLESKPFWTNLFN